MKEEEKKKKEREELTEEGLAKDVAKEEYGEEDENK